ncbi:uncharacterized protein TNCV_4736101 [Trichonephila clavipes]|nr:uncharacterized protein TNCV_4736101 [Trichonephila clavipes]
MAKKLQIQQLTIYRQVKKLGYKKANFRIYHQLSVKTVEKRRKRSCPLYLMLCKGRYKAWITSDEALFHLSFTTGKTKIQYIYRKKCRKNAAVLKRASWLSGVMVWMGMSPQGLRKPFFVEPKSKINAKYYYSKVLKHFIRESKRLYTQGNFVFHQQCAPNHIAKSTIK